MLKGHAFIVSLFLFGTVLSAAPHITRNYANRYFSTRDGLAQMQVMCAFQDKDGYIWFGTKGGVSRWDGVSFKNYGVDEGVPTGNILEIGEAGNSIVIMMLHHILLLEPSGRIKYINIPEGYSVSSNCFIPIGNNRILFPGIANIHNQVQFGIIYNFQTGKASRLKLFSENVYKCMHDTLITETGLFTYSKLNFKKILNFPFKLWGKSDLWIEGENLFLGNKSTGKLYKYKKHNHCYQTVWQKQFDSNDYVNCVILTEKKYLLDKKIESNRNPELSINISSPTFSFTDKEKNLWIGSDNGIYNFYGRAIQEYRFGIGEPDNVWSIVEDNKNSIWLGCYQLGLWKYNIDNTLTKIPDYNYSELQYMGSCKSPDGDIFMTYVRGIAQFQNGKLKATCRTGASLYAWYDSYTNNIFYSGDDSTRNIRGLYMGILPNRHFYPWTLGYPTTIIRDARNRLRVGAWRGQAILINDSLTVDKTKREYTSLICTELDAKKHLWKGTENGLYVELANGNEYRVGGKRIFGSILSMKIWRNKYLITGTQKSIIIVPLTQHRSWHDYEFTEIGYDAGFTGLESGQNGMCIDHNGDVWLSTALCVLKFNPEKLMQWQHQKIPPIRVSHISYSTDNTIWKAYYPESKPKDPFVFDDEYKFFRIEYICNSISAPLSLRFRYRLVGMSEKWSESVNTKSVSYTNLLPGKYTFEVECSMDGEHWSKPASSPEFIVLAPHLLRWYMLVLYLLVLVSTIIFISRWIIKRKEARKLDTLTRKKLENELQLNTLRSKVIPHFTKNVLSAIGHFAMTDKLRASHYIAVFSKFTQLTLSNADKNYNSLEEEINYLRTYLELEKMRFDARFDYKISIEQHVNTAILIPGMTLHTYCDNAIRHGLVNKKGSGFLSINITNHHNGVLIVVEDNGIGRERAQQLGTRGNGQGLLLIEQQLQFYNSQNSEAIYQTITDLKDENNMPSGTRVNLYIPKNYRFV